MRRDGAPGQGIHSGRTIRDQGQYAHQPCSMQSTNSCQAHCLSASARFFSYNPMRGHANIRCDSQMHGSHGYPTAPASTSGRHYFLMLQAPGGHAPWKRNWK
ncbi:hypothetical protein ACQKWADRAFT_287797 [Trichoderma austrokoningii]